MKQRSAFKAAAQAVLEPGFEFKGKDPEQFLKQKEEKEALNLEEKKYNYIQNLTLGKSTDYCSSETRHCREAPSSFKPAIVG